MSYKHKENKIKSGRPRSKNPKEVLPAISVESELKQAIESAALKLGKGHAEFRRTAYRMLVHYVEKKLPDGD